MLLKKGYNQSVDIWAMGIFMYELLMGKTPFTINEQQQEKQQQHQQTTIAQLEAIQLTKREALFEKIKSFTASDEELGIAQANIKISSSPDRLKQDCSNIDIDYKHLSYEVIYLFKSLLNPNPAMRLSLDDYAASKWLNS